MRPVLLSPADWPAYAERLRSHLGTMAAGSGGRYDAADIEAEILSGRLEAWIAIDGDEIGCLLVTYIAQYPRFDALRLVGIVGSQPRRWLKLLGVVEAAARDRGCTRTEAMHPVAWAPILARYGWVPFHTLSEKIL